MVANHVEVDSSFSEIFQYARLCEDRGVIHLGRGCQQGEMFLAQPVFKGWLNLIAP
jgi:hypothetical protein